MRRITRPLLILLAIVFLIEAWLWRHLEPIVERIVAWLPLRAVKAAIAGVIRKLPPYATLIVFLVPMAALFPLKLLGLWLLANKHWFAAGLILIFAKLVGLAITAFVFEVTKPKLLKMAWFRRIYEHVLIWLEWARALVDPIRLRMRRLLVLVRGERGRRAIRLLWRIRRRMNRERRLAGKPVSADAAGVARAAQAS
ncbi:MAG: hypothetical protein NTV56_16030 [Alphaproteobacteria bacterium]|nr:hypothetical protein [Alphaproteobacteria bacterium]